MDVFFIIRVCGIYFPILQCVQCSLNIVSFSMNSRKVATAPSPALGCYLWYKKLQASKALKVSYSNVDEGGVAVNCEKSIIFPEHPVFANGLC